jgi:alkylation response protein AidB-like acyl-CoA dehydrogenase
VILDATDQQGLAVAPQRLVAANASSTVQLHFDDVDVPADRVVSETPYDAETYLGTERLALNGSLSIGVAARCCRLIGASGLDEELAACRAALASAEGDAVFGARAAASELAVRAAAALAVNTGSSASLIGQHAPRLMREAMFLLVFGSRPGIRAALLNRLGAQT